MRSTLLPSVKGYRVENKQRDLSDRMFSHTQHGKSWGELQTELREAWHDGDEETCREIIGRMYAVRLRGEATETFK